MIKVKAFVFVCAGPAERMFGPNGVLISLLASGWKAIATPESALLVRMLGSLSTARAEDPESPIKIHLEETTCQLKVISIRWNHALSVG